MSSNVELDEPELCEGCGFEVSECLCDPIERDGFGVDDQPELTYGELESLTINNQLSGEEEIIGSGSDIITRKGLR